MIRLFKKAFWCCLRLCAIPRDWFVCFRSGISYRKSWQFRGVPDIRKSKGAYVSIGERFAACSKSWYNSLGVFQPVTIRVGVNAKLIIGDDVGASGCTLSAAQEISIGNHVLIGSGVMITDSDAHPLDYIERRSACAGGKSKPVVIEDDAFIGARAIILKGVTIGRGSIVGAGAVVSKSCPPFSVLVGNPAIVVRSCDRKD